MALGSSALFNFLVVLAIGAVIGVLLNRYVRAWLTRLAGPSHADRTAALVGIAGGFIGFHSSVIVGLLPSPLMHFVAAAAGAALTVWLWSRS
jgi:hypothetical protein